MGITLFNKNVMPISIEKHTKGLNTTIAVENSNNIHFNKV